MQTRIERYKTLRTRIMREIELDREINESKKNLEVYFNRLSNIDHDFFSDIKTQFEQQFSWEKIYLEKNPNLEPYSPMLKYNIAQLLEQVSSKIDLKANNKLDKLDTGKIIENMLESETSFNKPLYEKYTNILDQIIEQQNVYNIKINHLIKKNANPQINSTNINLKLVEQIRTQDKRTTNEMLKSVNLNIDEKSSQVVSSFRKIKANRKISLLVILVLLLVIDIICVVLIMN